MRLLQLTCEGFRNLADVRFEPDFGMNLICGENGMGKTNLLEAIWMLTGAKSFRNAKDSEMIGFSRQQATLKAQIHSGGIQKQLGLIIGEKKEAEIFGKPQKSAAAFTKHFNAVVFSPQDIALAAEGPGVKRKFLDLCLCQLFPRYLSALKGYTRLLNQRNAVLRDTRYHPELVSLIVPIEQQMSAAAAVITEYRMRLCRKLEEIFPRIYHEIAGGRETVSLTYLPKAGEDLFKALDSSRKDDMHSGVTSVGPHRDDLLLCMNGNGVRGFSSQGQKRCAALSLRLAEAEVIKSVKGEDPVILLDDVMSELDPARQKTLLSLFSGGQVFLSCCDENNIGSMLAGKMIRIENGAII